MTYNNASPKPATPPVEAHRRAVALKYHTDSSGDGDVSLASPAPAGGTGGTDVAARIRARSNAARAAARTVAHAAARAGTGTAAGAVTASAPQNLDSNRQRSIAFESNREKSPSKSNRPHALSQSRSPNRPRNLLRFSRRTLAAAATLAAASLYSSISNSNFALPNSTIPFPKLPAPHFAGIASAATYTWTGTAGGTGTPLSFNWADTLNWDDGSYFPSQNAATDDAHFPFYLSSLFNSVISLSGDIALKSLTAEDGAYTTDKLTIGATAKAQSITFSGNQNYAGAQDSGVFVNSVFGGEFVVNTNLKLTTTNTNLRIVNDSANKARLTIEGDIYALQNNQHIYFDVNSLDARITINGNIKTFANNTNSIVKDGAGTLFINSQNDGTGMMSGVSNVEFNGGTIAIGQNYALGNTGGTITLGASGGAKTLQIYDLTNSSLSPTLGNSIDIAYSDLIVTRANSLNVTAITLNLTPPSSKPYTSGIGSGTRTLTVTDNVTLSVAANQTFSGSGTLVKAGKGNLTLRAPGSTFAGFTLNEGFSVTAYVTGNQSLGTGGSGSVLGLGLAAAGGITIKGENINQTLNILTSSATFVTNSLTFLADSSLTLQSGAQINIARTAINLDGGKFVVDANSGSVLVRFGYTTTTENASDTYRAPLSITGGGVFEVKEQSSTATAIPKITFSTSPVTIGKADGTDTGGSIFRLNENSRVSYLGFAYTSPLTIYKGGTVLFDTNSAFAAYFGYAPDVTTGGTYYNSSITVAGGQFIVAAGRDEDTRIIKTSTSTNLSISGSTGLFLIDTNAYLDDFTIGGDMVLSDEGTFKINSSARSSTTFSKTVTITGDAKFIRETDARSQVSIAGILTIGNSTTGGTFEIKAPTGSTGSYSVKATGNVVVNNGLLKISDYNSAITLTDAATDTFSLNGGTVNFSDLAGYSNVVTIAGKLELLGGSFLAGANATYTPVNFTGTTLVLGNTALQNWEGAGTTWNVNGETYTKGNFDYAGALVFASTGTGSIAGDTEFRINLKNSGSLSYVDYAIANGAPDDTENGSLKVKDIHLNLTLSRDSGTATIQNSIRSLTSTEPIYFIGTGSAGGGFSLTRTNQWRADIIAVEGANGFINLDKYSQGTAGNQFNITFQENALFSFDLGKGFYATLNPEETSNPAGYADVKTQLSLGNIISTAGDSFRLGIKNWYPAGVGKATTATADIITATNQNSLTDEQLANIWFQGYTKGAAIMIINGVQQIVPATIKKHADDSSIPIVYTDATFDNKFDSNSSPRTTVNAWGDSYSWIGDDEMLVPDYPGAIARFSMPNNSANQSVSFVTLSSQSYIVGQLLISGNNTNLSFDSSNPNGTLVFDNSVNSANAVFSFTNSTYTGNNFDLTFYPNIELRSNLTFEVDSVPRYGLRIYGNKAITEKGGSFGITKTGSGALIFDSGQTGAEQVHTFTGNVYLLEGTLGINNQSGITFGNGTSQIIASNGTNIVAYANTALATFTGTDGVVLPPRFYNPLVIAEADATIGLRNVYLNPNAGNTTETVITGDVTFNLVQVLGSSASATLGNVALGENMKITGTGSLTFGMETSGTFAVPTADNSSTQDGKTFIIRGLDNTYSGDTYINVPKLRIAPPEPATGSTEIVLGALAAGKNPLGTGDIYVDNGIETIPGVSLNGTPIYRLIPAEFTIEVPSATDANPVSVTLNSKIQLDNGADFRVKTPATAITENSSHTVFTLNTGALITSSTYNATLNNVLKDPTVANKTSNYTATEVNNSVSLRGNFSLSSANLIFNGGTIEKVNATYAGVNISATGSATGTTVGLGNNVTFTGNINVAPSVGAIQSDGAYFYLNNAKLTLTRTNQISNYLPVSASAGDGTFTMHGNSALSIAGAAGTQIDLSNYTFNITGGVSNISLGEAGGITFYNVAERWGLWEYETGTGWLLKELPTVILSGTSAGGGLWATLDPTTLEWTGTVGQNPYIRFDEDPHNFLSAAALALFALPGYPPGVIISAETDGYWYLGRAGGGAGYYFYEWSGNAQNGSTGSQFVNSLADHNWTSANPHNHSANAGMQDADGTSTVNISIRDLDTALENKTIFINENINIARISSESSHNYAIGSGYNSSDSLDAGDTTPADAGGRLIFTKGYDAADELPTPFIRHQGRGTLTFSGLVEFANDTTLSEEMPPETGFTVFSGTLFGTGNLIAKGNAGDALLVMQGNGNCWTGGLVIKSGTLRIGGTNENVLGKGTFQIGDPLSPPTEQVIIQTEQKVAAGNTPAALSAQTVAAPWQLNAATLLFGRDTEIFNVGSSVGDQNIHALILSGAGTLSAGDHTIKVAENNYLYLDSAITGGSTADTGTILRINTGSTTAESYKGQVFFTQNNAATLQSDIVFEGVNTAYVNIAADDALGTGKLTLSSTINYVFGVAAGTPYQDGSGKTFTGAINYPVSLTFPTIKTSYDYTTYNGPLTRNTYHLSNEVIFNQTSSGQNRFRDVYLDGNQVIAVTKTNTTQPLIYVDGSTDGANGAALIIGENVFFNGDSGKTLYFNGSGWNALALILSNNYDSFTGTFVKGTLNILIGQDAALGSGPLTFSGSTGVIGAFGRDEVSRSIPNKINFSSNIYVKNEGSTTELIFSNTTNAITVSRAYNSSSNIAVLDAAQKLTINSPITGSGGITFGTTEGKIVPGTIELTNGNNTWAGTTANNALRTTAQINRHAQVLIRPEDGDVYVGFLASDSSVPEGTTYFGRITSLGTVSYPNYIIDGELSKTTTTYYVDSLTRSALNLQPQDGDVHIQGYWLIQRAGILSSAPADGHKTFIYSGSTMTASSTLYLITATLPTVFRTAATDRYETPDYSTSSPTINNRGRGEFRFSGIVEKSDDAGVFSLGAMLIPENPSSYLRVTAGTVKTLQADVLSQVSRIELAGDGATIDVSAQALANPNHLQTIAVPTIYDEQTGLPVNYTAHITLGAGTSFVGSTANVFRVIVDDFDIADSEHGILQFDNVSFVAGHEHEGIGSALVYVNQPAGTHYSGVSVVPGFNDSIVYFNTYGQYVLVPFDEVYEWNNLAGHGTGETFEPSLGTQTQQWKAQNWESKAMEGFDGDAGFIWPREVGSLARFNTDKMVNYVDLPATTDTVEGNGDSDRIPVVIPGVIPITFSETNGIGILEFTGNRKIVHGSYINAAGGDLGTAPNTLNNTAGDIGHNGTDYDGITFTNGGSGLLLSTLHPTANSSVSISNTGATDINFEIGIRLGFDSTTGYADNLNIIQKGDGALTFRGTIDSGPSTVSLTGKDFASHTAAGKTTAQIYRGEATGPVIFAASGGADNNFAGGFILNAIGTTVRLGNSSDITHGKGPLGAGTLDLRAGTLQGWQLFINDHTALVSYDRHDLTAGEPKSIILENAYVLNGGFGAAGGTTSQQNNNSTKITLIGTASQLSNSEIYLNAGANLVIGTAGTHAALSLHPNADPAAKFYLFFTGDTNYADYSSSFGKATVNLAITNSTKLALGGGAHVKFTDALGTQTGSPAISAKYENNISLGDKSEITFSQGSLYQEIAGIIGFVDADIMTIGRGVANSTGAVVKEGAGTLLLTGRNIYEGSTTVTGGKIILGDGTEDADNLPNGTLGALRSYTMAGETFDAYIYTGNANAASAGSSGLILKNGTTFTVNQAAGTKQVIEYVNAENNASYNTNTSIIEVTGGSTLILGNAGTRPVAGTYRTVNPNPQSSETISTIYFPYGAIASNNTYDINPGTRQGFAGDVNGNIIAKNSNPTLFELPAQLEVGTTSAVTAFKTPDNITLGDYSQLLLNIGNAPAAQNASGYIHDFANTASSAGDTYNDFIILSGSSSTVTFGTGVKIVVTFNDSTIFDDYADLYIPIIKTDGDGSNAASISLTNSPTLGDVILPDGWNIRYARGVLQNNLFVEHTGASIAQTDWAWLVIESPSSVVWDGQLDNNNLEGTSVINGYDIWSASRTGGKFWISENSLKPDGATSDNRVWSGKRAIFGDASIVTGGNDAEAPTRVTVFLSTQTVVENGDATTGVVSSVSTSGAVGSAPVYVNELVFKQSSGAGRVYTITPYTISNYAGGANTRGDVLLGAEDTGALSIEVEHRAIIAVPIADDTAHSKTTTLTKYGDGTLVLGGEYTKTNDVNYIANNGLVTRLSNGTLTYSANSYSGKTIVKEGTLQLTGTLNNSDAPVPAVIIDTPTWHETESHYKNELIIGDDGDGTAGTFHLTQDDHRIFYKIETNGSISEVDSRELSASEVDARTGFPINFPFTAYKQFETRQFFDGRVTGSTGTFIHEGATTAVFTFFDSANGTVLSAQNALNSVEVKTNARFVLAPANGSHTTQITGDYTYTVSGLPADDPNTISTPKNNLPNGGLVLGTLDYRGTLSVTNYGIFEGYGTLVGNLTINSGFLRPGAGTDIAAGKQFATLRVLGNVTVENHSVIQLALDTSSRQIANPRLLVLPETGVTGSTGTLNINQDTYLTVSLSPALATDIRAAINANGGNKTNYPLYLIAASQILDSGAALSISVADIALEIFNKRSATITAEDITFDVFAGTRKIGTEDVNVIFLSNAWFGGTGGIGANIPEPSTYALAGTALLAGLLWLRRRRHKNHKGGN